VTGLLVPPRDAGALAAAIERLASDPDLVDRLAGAGRRLVAERYELDVVAQRLIAAFAAHGAARPATTPAIEAAAVPPSR
jgi:glycosyltransferase involved in cell wall biosynthesis